MNMVKVTGNIVSNNGITLFFADGSSQVMPNDGYKVQAILDAILPPLMRREHPEIDLDSFSLAGAVKAATNGALKVEETATGLQITTPNGKVIENGNALQQHVEAIVADPRNGKGFQKFLLTFGKMMDERKHTADELLGFLQGADLPIADDGSIIGYKVLVDSGNHMVDPHTKMVKQKLGSLVYMPASKVDDNRRELCSTGLHIAARSYLGGFFYHGNNKLCLVKIKPDDVISVPERETSKMRVCAYHIVKVFSASDAQAIVNGTSIESLPNAAKALSEAVAGIHDPILERVSVGEKGEHTAEDVEQKPAKATKPKKARPLTSGIVAKARATVQSVKNAIAKLSPYDKKLAKAQKDYDDGMSIREIAKKHGMDRESLGKNLTRKPGR